MSGVPEEAGSREIAMASLRLLQVNAGRDRASMAAIKERATEIGADVVCLREPYHDWDDWAAHSRVIGDLKGKALMVIRDSGLGVLVRRDLCGRNIAACALEGEGWRCVVVCAYVEPQGDLTGILDAVSGAIRFTDCIVFGDFNAKNEAWGWGNYGWQR